MNAAITRLAALFLLLAASAPATAQPADLILQDLDGETHRLSALRGKWVVVNYWATWCPPCIEEMPELERFHQRHKDRDAVVWGVTFEDTPREEVIAFVKRLGVTYPILGLGEKPAMPFGRVAGLPTTYVIDPQGEVSKRFLGPVTGAHLEVAITR